MSRGGIDYSKWDRLDVSDDDDDDASTSRRPRVTRLDRPSQVTLSPQGDVAVTSTARRQVKSARTSSDPLIDSKPRADGDALPGGSASSSEPPSTIFPPLEWTERGGSFAWQPTTEPGMVIRTGCTLFWTQDRQSVTFRCEVPADVPTKGWKVQIEGMKEYADRNVDVSSSSDKPWIRVWRKDADSGQSLVLLQGSLPHQIHRAPEDEDDPSRMVDWTIERVPTTPPGNRPFITFTMLKAAPMQGVVVWWNRPLLEAPEISMEWRSKTSSAVTFQRAWDEAHRQFRKQMADQKRES